MKTLTRCTRRVLVLMGMAALLAAPAAAQTTAGTGTDATMGAGTQTTSTMPMGMDTTTRTEDRGGFPWGLLGLLGLAGLMRKPQRDTVVTRDASYRDTSTTGRPGDPNYRA